MAVMGRPTDYKPEYCEQLLDYMRQGGSFEGFCGTAMVDFATLREWVDRHPDFGAAKERGELLAYQFWENLAKAGIAGQLKTKTSKWIYKDVLDENGQPKRDARGELLREKVMVEGAEVPANFNASAFIFMMKNRYGWRDKQDIELTGKDGGPIATVTATIQEVEERFKRINDRISKTVAKRLPGDDGT